MNEPRGPENLFEDMPVLGTHRIDLSLRIGLDPRAAVSIRANISGVPDVGVTDSLIDPDGLADSMRGPGEHVIFTCSCGDPECGGFSQVTTQIDVETVTWTWKSAGGERRAVFERCRIEAAISGVLEAREAVISGLIAAGIEVETVPLEYRDPGPLL